MPPRASRDANRARTTAPDDPRTWPVRREVSAGGIVVRDTLGGRDVALIRPRSTDDRIVWALPKGIVEPGEDPQATAVREVREETGLDAEIVQAIDPLQYWYTWPPDKTRIRKTVHVFLMRLRGGDVVDHDDEVAEVRFVPVDRAAAEATYRSEKAALRTAAGLVAKW